MKIKVYVTLNLAEPLTYEYSGDPAAIGKGSRVLVPLGRKIVSGWVADEDSAYAGPLKPVFGIIRDPDRPDETFLRFIMAVAERFRISPGLLLDLSLPAAKKNLRRLRGEWQGKTLGLAEATQKMADGSPSVPLDFFMPAPAGSPASAPCPKSSCTSGNFAEHLLLGPSRETKLAEAISGWISAGRSALMIVPDTATAEFWRKRISGIVPYHADLRAREKEEAWQQARNGDPRPFVGSLSALFLPLPTLGGIIVDRIGAPTFHSSWHSGLELPEAARIRAKTYGIPLWMAGSSHSLRTYHDRSSLIIHDERPSRQMPAETFMLKRGKRGIPTELIDLIAESHAQGRRIWIIMSQKTGSVYLHCTKCQKPASCPNCQTPLQTDARGMLACPVCAYVGGPSSVCPSCQGKLEISREMGMDTLAEAIQRRISEAGPLILTETRSTKETGLLDQALTTEIVLSTPRWITPLFAGRFDTIVYFRPESQFRMNRFKSAERIFTAVAELRDCLRPDGRLLLFTAYHFHYVFQWINLEAEFWEREMKYREWFHLPPFSQVFRLEMRSPDLRQLASRMRKLKALEDGRMKIARIGLVDRRQVRGNYRGTAEIHGWLPHLEAKGIFSLKAASIVAINE